VILLVLSACETEAPPKATYVQSISSADPLAACQAIEDRSDRGDCVTFAVSEIAVRGDTRALGACLDLVGHWKRVCVLEYSDASGTTGAEAEEICLEAGDLRERCLAHSIAREVSAMWRNREAGTEAEVLEFALQRSEESGYTRLPGARRDLASELVGQAVVQEHLKPGIVLSQEVCGTLPEDACQESMVAALRNRKVPRSHCQRGQAGLTMNPPFEWDPAFEPVMLAAWTEYCGG